ncbi:hydroxyacylglutathione hydrolase [mine drainage metagenome]|uniref:Hydroxyacylglutathione hydrolase n=1 Tax=mine drainage metagenome TaxID=410659 RepID=A0A1J5TQN0_9ZZZZ
MAQSHEHIPLEDELGDVLDKAMGLAGMSTEETADAAGIELSRLQDALDWRSDLTCEEVSRLAHILSLNEVGLSAVASGGYPQPEVGGLPFCLYPLRMPHGIGVVNAYIVSECGSERGLLFDTGPGLDALRTVWPAKIKHIDAVFLTHVEAEHVGGLCEVMSHLRIPKAFIPSGAEAPCGQALPDGGKWAGPYLTVTAFHTPGHAAAHNGYLVETVCGCQCRKLFVTGDLLFAGSVGCAFYCRNRLRDSVRRVLGALPPNTVLAPGHGPLTTVANELKYNPFVV